VKPGCLAAPERVAVARMPAASSTGKGL
jgi:hypothetical protein